MSQPNSTSRIYRSKNSLLILLHILFFLSGIAGLGYQLIWTRLFAVGLGHEIPSVFSIITAFFGGIALGSWFLDKYIMQSKKPGHWYIALELVIGLWGILSVILIPKVNSLILALIGSNPSATWHWAVSFTIPFLSLLPATVSMGATLPAMERLTQLLTNEKHTVSSLYSVNTFGAMIGTYAVVFLLSPVLGYNSVLALLICFNLGSALFTWFLIKTPTSNTLANTPPQLTPKGYLVSLLFLTGFFGIGYEVIGIRGLAQFLDNTVFTYAAILIVFLLGTSLGAFLYHALNKSPLFNIGPFHLILYLSISCLFGLWMLQYLSDIFSTSSTTSTLNEKLHSNLKELLAATLVFFFPTCGMGALLSSLLHQVKEQGYGIGRALAINTTGATFAPFLFGLFLLPTLGIYKSILILCLGYATLLLSKHRFFYAIFPAIIIAGSLSVHSLMAPSPNPGVLDYQDGIMASISVEKLPNNARVLKVNNHYQMGSTQGVSTERRQAHTPLLLHPNPKKVLFLGIGTGITLGATTEYPDLTVTGVELVPEIVDVLPLFAPENNWPMNSQTQIIAGDARRYIRSTPEKYDVIVADLFHPARDGAGTLYTTEHFQTVRSKLSTGGLFCQWLPLYQLDTPVFKMIVRTFLEVFPHTKAFIGNYNVDTPGLALIAFTQPTSYKLPWIEHRLSGKQNKHLKSVITQEIGLSDYNLFSGYIASTPQLKHFSKNAPINTDNHPVVMYQAPHYLDSKTHTSHKVVASLIKSFQPNVSSLLHDDTPSSIQNNLDQVLQARNIYMQGAIHAKKGNLTTAIEKYLHSSTITEHFLVGYFVCLQMVLNNHQNQPEWSFQLAKKLLELHPQIKTTKNLGADFLNAFVLDMVSQKGLQSF